MEEEKTKFITTVKPKLRSPKIINKKPITIKSEESKSVDIPASKIKIEPGTSGNKSNKINKFSVKPRINVKIKMEPGVSGLKENYVKVKMEPGLSKVKARPIKPVPSSNLKVNSKFKILSHREYVKWANELSKRKHYKIEELSSGVAYCIILNNIAPKAMPLKHVKMDPTSKPESIHNLRLLQAALMKLKCEKVLL